MKKRRNALYDILNDLAEYGTAQSMIALGCRTGYTMTTITRSVRILMKVGLVTKRTDRISRKNKNIVLLTSSRAKWITSLNQCEVK